MDLLNCFTNHDELEAFLHTAGWLATARRIAAVTKAGDGNMNFTARIRCDNGASFILKQSPAYVAKYPHIPAPDKRILSEVAFYRATATVPALRRRLPALLFYSTSQKLACFEDLGAARDMTSIYGGERIDAETLAALLSWLSALHHAPLNPNDWGEVLVNRAMRELNHEHMFVIPLSGVGAPDLDAITPGLSEAGAALRSDRLYGKRVRELGATYLTNDRVLLHGDFYPGSWLRHADGPKIIDPEFAFFGKPEFDVGVCLAHLLLGGYAQSDALTAMRSYDATPDFSHELAQAFAGVEVMRRLLGVAQLPLQADLDTKRALLTSSHTLVLQR